MIHRLTSTVRAQPILATAVVCLLLSLSAGVLYDGFFSPRILSGFFANNAALGIVAVGMTFVILSGGIDLSVGAVVGCSTILLATLIERHGWHPATAIMATLFGGACFGGAMGYLIHAFVLPPFVVTLAGMFLARGLAFTISRDSIAIHHSFHESAYSATARLAESFGMNESDAVSFGSLVPTASVAFILVLAFGMLATKWTRFGRNVYAIGGAETSARLLGVPVGRTKTMVYALSGGCAALAGVVHTIATFSGNASNGMMWELDAIAAVVIGGTLLAGGIGGVSGTFLGIMIFGIIETAIRMDGRLNSWWTRIVIGALLLAFILLQRGLVRETKR